MKRAIGPRCHDGPNSEEKAWFLRGARRERGGVHCTALSCFAQARGVHCAALSCFAQARGVPPCTPVWRSEAVLHSKTPPNPCTPVGRSEAVLHCKAPPSPCTQGSTRTNQFHAFRSCVARWNSWPGLRHPTPAAASTLRELDRTPRPRPARGSRFPGERRTAGKVARIEPAFTPWMSVCHRLLYFGPFCDGRP
jgi:hypothetical protein